MAPRAVTLLALLLVAQPGQALELTGSAHRLLGGHVNAGSGGVGSLGQTGVVLASAPSAPTVGWGFWAFALPELFPSLLLSGVAQGGSVSITVDGVEITIFTSSGATAADAVADLAAAIESSPLLAELKARATSAGSALWTNGTVTSPLINDAGLTLSGAPIPTVSDAGLLVLAGLLLVLGVRTLRAAGATPSPGRA